MTTPIFDTHVHFWDVALLNYPWLEPDQPDEIFFVDVARLPARYLPLDYAADAVDTGVVPFVHIEAGCRSTDAVRETEWLASLASAPWPSGPALVVAADLSRADLPSLLDEHGAASGRIAGVREIITWHPDSRFTFVDRDLLMDKTWRRGLRTLEQRGLSFDLQIYPGQIDGALDIAREYAELRLIVEHAGLPLGLDTGGLPAWRSAMEMLAREPNVAIKVGGFAMVQREWALSEVVPLIRQLIDTFGPTRSMFASNFPVERANHSMQELREVWDEALRSLSVPEREQVSCGAASTWYQTSAPTSDFLKTPNGDSTRVF
jgi:predicted TIM-barrel fold metal-dependent hydrolase